MPVSQRGSSPQLHAKPTCVPTIRRREIAHDVVPDPRCELAPRPFPNVTTTAMESIFILLRPTCPTGYAVVAREDLATACWIEETYNCRRLTPSPSTGFPIPRPIDPEDTTVLDTTGFAEAERDVRELLEEGMRRMMAGDDSQDGWVEAAVIERVPSHAQAGYRLLALRAAQ